MNAQGETPMHSGDQTRLAEWLILLGGPSYQGEEARDRAIAEMQAAGAERLFPLLRPMLNDPNATARCKACEAILWIDKQQGVELVLPLLKDPEIGVRWHVCGCLHDFGNERAVDALIRVLAHDPYPDVRGAAAYALGGIGSPAAIPELLATMASDHERDIHNHTPSTTAATALDSILGSEVVHAWSDRLQDRVLVDQPDLRRLRELAEAAYKAWLASRK